MQSWPLGTPRKTGIHDLAPAPDGGVWFTAQFSGHLGWFDPASGRTELIALGSGSSPHGVIQGPDKAAWITDGGQNAIVRVGWPDRKLQVFPLPRSSPYANLNTAAFDGEGDLWFTGQSGYVGKLALKSGQVSVKEAPRGRGPYGICATPAGDSLVVFAGRLLHRPHRPAHRRIGGRRAAHAQPGRAPRLERQPRPASGSANGTAASWRCTTRQAGSWNQWKLPGTDPKAYAVYVDERDMVWVSEWSGNAVFRFDPRSQKFERFAFPRDSANVRQILGRRGEVWLPESGTEHITVIRTA